MSTNTKWKRFANLDDVSEEQPPAPKCTYCGGVVEDNPMLRDVCYGCYRNLIENLTLSDAVALAYAAHELKPEHEAQAAELVRDTEWLAEAEAQHADWLDEQDTRESVRPM